jgi:hypothetical protein
MVTVRKKPQYVNFAMSLMKTLWILTNKTFKNLVGFFKSLNFWVFNHPNFCYVFGEDFMDSKKLIKTSQFFFFKSLNLLETIPTGGG